jgi:hypothetical protein
MNYSKPRHAPQKVIFTNLGWEATLTGTALTFLSKFKS